MRQIPALIKSVDKKIRAADGCFNAEKHLDSDFVLKLFAFLVVGAVELNHFFIALAPYIVADVTVNKVVGYENSVIALGFVKLHLFSDGGSCTRTYG